MRRPGPVDSVESSDQQTTPALEIDDSKEVSRNPTVAVPETPLERIPPFGEGAVGAYSSSHNKNGKEQVEEDSLANHLGDRESYGIQG